MMHYSDKEFGEVTGSKKGVVVAFKRVLREHGLIGNHAKLTENHVEIFNRCVKYKNETASTWEDSYEHILKQEGLINRNKHESLDGGKSLSEQIKSILELHDNGVLDQAQAFEVIRNLV